MVERMSRILGLLKAKGTETPLAGISGFTTEDAVFELQTEFSKHGHRTFLKYELSSDVIRMELTHVFGHLDLTKTPNPAQFLLDMLIENSPSFRNSSACLGVKSFPPNLFLTLNATHPFGIRMSDEDISDILSFSLLDLFMGLMFQLPAPLVMWQ